MDQEIIIKMSDDLKEIKDNVKELSRDVGKSLMQIATCTAEITHIQDDIDQQKIQSTREFDKVWNKNREQDSCIQGVKNKLSYFAGGLGILVFVIGLIIGIMSLLK